MIVFLGHANSHVHPLSFGPAVFLTLVYKSLHESGVSWHVSKQQSVGSSPSRDISVLKQDTYASSFGWNAKSSVPCF